MLSEPSDYGGLHVAAAPHGGVLGACCILCEIWTMSVHVGTAGDRPRLSVRFCRLGRRIHVARGEGSYRTPVTLVLPSGIDAVARLIVGKSSPLVALKACVTKPVVSLCTCVSSFHFKATLEQFAVAKGE
jgi:hypothetical protein